MRAVTLEVRDPALHLTQHFCGLLADFEIGSEEHLIFYLYVLTLPKQDKHGNPQASHRLQKQIGLVEEYTEDRKRYKR